MIRIINLSYIVHCTSYIILLLALLPMKVFSQERIMVIADPHVLPQALIEADPNFDTYLSKQRKMIDLSEPIWNALMDSALKYKPSLLLIPGDLTRDGEPEAQTLVMNSLRQLEQAGIPSVIVPGNHDKTDWFTNTVAEPIKGLTILAFYDGVDVNWLVEQAEAAKSKGNTVIAMTHRQLIDHFDGKSTLESSARMTNSNAVRDSLMHHGVHLVLTGHFHVNSISTAFDTLSLTRDSLVELSTGSPITYPCPYRWLTLSPDRSTITVQTDYITSLENIPDMHAYSRAWMAQHAQILIPAIALKAFTKKDAILDKIRKLPFGSYFAPQLEGCIPDAEGMTQLIEKHLGATIVSLYLLHSDGNEYIHPEAASLSQAFQQGVQSLIAEMLDECTDAEMQRFIVAAVLDLAKTPIQSILTDVTECQSPLWANRTDDLQPRLVIAAPQSREDIEPVSAKLDGSCKIIKEGQLIIRQGEHIYNAQGAKLN